MQLLKIAFIVFVIHVHCESFQAQTKCNEPIRKAVWQTLPGNLQSDASDCRESLTVKPITLGRFKGNLVRGRSDFFCGVTGNCSTWIVSKAGKRSKIILNAGSAMDWIEKIPRGHQQYPDLVMRWRMGAADRYRGVFRFSGSVYRLRTCDYESNERDGKVYLQTANKKFCE
ncbi:MAG: hypothetical protein IPL32_01455 [Chloracidobacterium sp.]|nr:hypothetical protein [Chloracidobacterium sp.]